MHYVYDGNLVIQERDSNNVPVASYTRGLDLSGGWYGAGGIGGLLARTGTSSAYYHSDRGGNVTALINAQQIIVAKYLYDPVGNTMSQNGPLADVNPYRFSSKEQHSPSALYHFGARFYNSNLQRWLNRDPIGEAGGINLYAFGGNSAVNAVDPWGQDVDDLPDGEDDEGGRNYSAGVGPGFAPGNYGEASGGMRGESEVSNESGTLAAGDDAWPYTLSFGDPGHYIGGSGTAADPYIMGPSLIIAFPNAESMASFLSGLKFSDTGGIGGGSLAGIGGGIGGNGGGLGSSIRAGAIGSLKTTAGWAYDAVYDMGATLAGGGTGLASRAINGLVPNTATGYGLGQLSDYYFSLRSPAARAGWYDPHSFGIKAANYLSIVLNPEGAGSKINMFRDLTVADLGVKGTVTQLKGSLAINNGIARVNVAALRGKIENPLQLIKNLANTAKAEGATALRIEAQISNPRLRNVLEGRYNMFRSGDKDVIIILLE